MAGNTAKADTNGESHPRGNTAKADTKGESHPRGNTAGKSP